MELIRKIENASKDYIPHHINDEFVEFSAIERRNHPSIIKVTLLTHVIVLFFFFENSRSLVIRINFFKLFTYG